MQDNVTFEHPLNERIRIFLRLEWFFKQLTYFQNTKTSWDAVAAMQALLEILAILERNDVKTEILKELERHINSLQRLLTTSHVDIARLEATIAELKQYSQQIYSCPSRLSSSIKENELIMALRQRAAISGGCLTFDIPTYNLWLHKPAEIRQEMLLRWVEEFIPLKNALNALLNLIRASGTFELKVALNGGYQKVLESQAPCQLVRIALLAEANIFSEISASRHRINIRFLNFNEKSKAQQVQHNLEFFICCCII